MENFRAIEEGLEEYLTDQYGQPIPYYGLQKGPVSHKIYPRSPELLQKIVKAYTMLRIFLNPPIDPEDVRIEVEKNSFRRAISELYAQF